MQLGDVLMRLVESLGGALVASWCISGSGGRSQEVLAMFWVHLGASWIVVLFEAQEII